MLESAAWLLMRGLQLVRLREQLQSVCEMLDGRGYVFKTQCAGRILGKLVSLCDLRQRWLVARNGIE